MKRLAASLVRLAVSSALVFASSCAGARERDDVQLRAAEIVARNVETLADAGRTDEAARLVERAASRTVPGSRARAVLEEARTRLYSRRRPVPEGPEEIEVDVAAGADTTVEVTLEVLRDRPAYVAWVHEPAGDWLDGFYLGVSGGITDAHASAELLTDTLAENGQTAVVVLDDTEFGWKAFVGYRFDAPLALELAYVSQEGPESAIRPVGSTLATLEDIIERIHPRTGRGPALSVLGFPYEDDRLSVFGRLGLWYWRSNLDVFIPAAGGMPAIESKFEDDDLDLFLGAGARYRVYDGLGLRFDWEHYYLDGDEIDLWTLGLVYEF